jgi:heterodisulfide reductase subunit A
VDEDRVVYLRGRVSRIFEKGGSVIVRGVDTLSSQQVEIRADLVVLATAVTGPAGGADLARRLRISADRYGFMTEAHPKLRPVETTTAGIFLAGACQAPKDIPDTVSQAGAAAGKAIGILSREQLVRHPMVAVVDRRRCLGCFTCEAVCPYGAVERDSWENPETGKEMETAVINAGLCEGCGACIPACRPGALDLRGYSESQIYGEIDGLADIFKARRE